MKDRLDILIRQKSSDYSLVYLSDDGEGGGHPGKVGGRDVKKSS